MLEAEEERQSLPERESEREVDPLSLFAPPLSPRRRRAARAIALTVETERKGNDDDCGGKSGEGSGAGDSHWSSGLGGEIGRDAIRRNGAF